MAEKKKPNLVYVAVLAVAGVGLAFDKFVLSAEAGVGNVHAVAVVDTASTPQAVATAETPREPLADQFNNAFTRLPPPVLRRQDAFSRPHVASTGVAITETSVQTGAGFESRHRLTSVLNQKSGDIAVVDGQLIKIGDVIEGMELVQVEKDGAVFRSGDTEIRLQLARPGLDR